MRSAARMPEPEPAPERSDLDAKAASLLDGHAELIAGAHALMARCPDPQSAALLRHLVTEIVHLQRHTGELRSQMAAYAETNESLDVAFAAGRAFERAQADAPKVPRQGHRATGGWHQPGIMRRVKVVAFIAVLGGGLRSLARAHRVAATLTALTLPVAAGAYVALVPGVTHPAGGPSAGPDAVVPGLHTSASPFPSSSLAGLTRPKPKHAARGKTLLAAGGLLPVYGPAPEQSSSLASPSASASVSVAAGPATLSVSTTGLDLSDPLDPQATFTISATGSGEEWASWRISTTGTDLDFSQDHGVLKAGQSVTLTVSVDAAQAVDGNLSQTFTIAGQQVTVSLPALVSSVLPSPVASILPSVVPSGL